MTYGVLTSLRLFGTMRLIAGAAMAVENTVRLSKSVDKILTTYRRNREVEVDVLEDARAEHPASAKEAQLHSMPME